VLLGLWYGFGYVRLHNANHVLASHLRVALLQGNIEQEMKSHARLYASDIIDIYKGLFEESINQGAELIVWPESAYPRIVRENITNFPMDFVTQAATIIGGVAYGEDANSGHDYVRNAAFILDHQGQVIKRYDKSHLVPFGEYVPWPLTQVVQKIVPGIGAFLPGVSYDVVPLALNPTKVVKVGVTICYEGIFPEISRAYRLKSAELLINITNDAWYGRSSAPYQHLQMYRLRSVETGLPFLRATNSGISATIDSYGRVKQKLGLFERGLMVDDIRLTKKPTLYALLGDVIPIICLILLLVFYVAAIVPIHKFIREKNFKKIGIVCSLMLIPFAGELYFSNPRFMTDESARTKSFLISIAAVLLMIGFLQRTKRTKTILTICGLITIVASLGLVWLDSYWFLLGALVGLLIYLVALSIRASESKT
jgi:apolipoprotein N-acyltransferase